MILTGNDCDHFDQILNSLHFPRFPLWPLTFHLLLSFFLIRVFCSLPFLAFFLVLIDDRRLLSIKTKLGLNRCLSQGTKAVSQLLDAKILHFGIISGHSGHGNFRSKSFGDAMFLQNLRVSTKIINQKSPWAGVNAHGLYSLNEWYHVKRKQQCVAVFPWFSSFHLRILSYILRLNILCIILFFLYSAAKIRKISENEQDKWRISDSPEIFYGEISDSPEIWWLIKSTNSKIFSFLFVDLFFFVYLYHRIAKWIRRWCFPLPIYIIRKRNEDCKGIIWRTE